MELADEADFALSNDNEAVYFSKIKESFEMEKEAALQLMEQFGLEPSRSILFKSAAYLAIECNELREAERMISFALAGNPPLEIAEELRNLYEQVNFKRHLQLKGVSLEEDELQLAIAGNEVGLGVVESEEFVKRVDFAEKMIFRVAERIARHPFKARAKVPEHLHLYMSVPRAASFAVSLKIGSMETETKEDYPAKNEIIKEIFDCLDVFNNEGEKGLKDLIKDDDYLRNFIGLTRELAPDGDRINLVGFTAVIGKQHREIVIEKTKSQIKIPSKKRKKINLDELKDITVEGILTFADKKGERFKINNEEEGITYTVLIEKGLCDIVKPYWDEYVKIEGKLKDKKKHILIFQNILSLG